MDFNRYFSYDDKIFLQNVSFETFEVKPSPGLSLNCKDTVVAQLMDKGVKINFNRALGFDPEGPFSLSVTFGAILNFKPETKDEIDWKTTDIAGEIKKSCPRLITSFMSRAALLVAEITASAGQVPLMTPGTPKREERQL